MLFHETNTIKNRDLDKSKAEDLPSRNKRHIMDN